jgi:hypothetical protein
MSRRHKAWLMVLVLGLVLPLAGSPLRYCLCDNMLLLAGTPPCPCDAEAADADCGEEQQHPAPAQPDCMVSLRLLPEALPQADPALPSPVVADLPPPVFAAPETPLVPQVVADVPRDRGPPPPGPPIYLRDRSLLL